MPRTKGAINSATRRAAAAMDKNFKALGGKLALAHLYTVLRDPNTPDEKKLKVAAILAPFEAPKQSAVLQANVTPTAAPTSPPAIEHKPAEGDGLRALQKILEGHDLVRMQEAARAELKARMANSSDAELRALAGIVEIEQPKEPRPKGKVESRELVPVKVPEHKFNKVEHVAPEPRGSVTDSPGSPFNMNGGGPQVGSRTPDGGVVTDISCNVKFK